MSSASHSATKSVLAKRAFPDPNARFPYYVDLFLQAQSNAWSETNPEGAILLSVAENHISVDLLRERLLKDVEFPTDGFAYQDPSGIPELKRAFIQLLQSTFLKGHELEADNVLISLGAGGGLERIFFAILDPGDGVLTIAPHYAGYLFDIGFHVQGESIAVYLDPEIDVYETLTQAKEESESGGTPIRALIVTNPDNPTATILPESTLTAIASWCADHQIHLIANELYANSIFNEEPVKFRSLFEICRELDREELKERIHLIYGLSKDFACSGLRVGMVYTESTPLMTRLKQGAVTGSVPFLLQQQLATVISDPSFLQSYISENKRRLKQSYDTLTGELEEEGIAYQKAQAGLFVMIDLRQALRQPGFEGEEALCRGLAQYGVLLTPGSSCRYREPGFFRICFATVPSTVLVIAVQRIAKFVGSQP